MNDRAKIVLWLGLIMIIVQVVKEWQAIKSVLFTGNGISLGSSLTDAPPPFGATPTGNPGQQMKSGETYWQTHGQKSNCPPGFPAGMTCLGM